MSKPVRKHVQSKRHARKPHLLPQVSNGSEGNPKARPSSKAATRTPKGRGIRSSRSQEPQEGQEVDSGATALITIQRESSGKWKWDCYDRHGLKTGTQQNCEDALQAIENIIGWLNAELVIADSQGR